MTKEKLLQTEFDNADMELSGNYINHKSLSVIHEAMDEWAAIQNRVLIDALKEITEDLYPEDVFLPISETEWHGIVDYLTKGGYSVDRISGHYGRLFHRIHRVIANTALAPYADAVPQEDLQKEVEVLRQWKKEAMAVYDPIHEYAQHHPDIKLGASMVSFVVDRAKMYDKMQRQVTGKSAGVWVKHSERLPESMIWRIPDPQEGFRSIDPYQHYDHDQKDVYFKDGLKIARNLIEWLNESGEVGKQPSVKHFDNDLSVVYDGGEDNPFVQINRVFDYIQGERKYSIDQLAKYRNTLVSIIGRMGEEIERLKQQEEVAGKQPEQQPVPSNDEIVSWATHQGNEYKKNNRAIPGVNDIAAFVFADGYVAGFTASQSRNTPEQDPWIPLKSWDKQGHLEAGKDFLFLYDTGEIRRRDEEEHPFAGLTHYMEIPSTPGSAQSDVSGEQQLEDKREAEDA